MNIETVNRRKRLFNYLVIRKLSSFKLFSIFPPQQKATENCPSIIYYLNVENATKLLHKHIDMKETKELNLKPKRRKASMGESFGDEEKL